LISSYQTDLKKKLIVPKVYSV